MTPEISTQVPDASAVHALAARIEAEDGAPPLSDQALSLLSDPDVTHLSAHNGDRLVGYAQLNGETLEIAATGDSGPGLLDAAGDGTLLVWSHGRRSRLQGLLEGGGFVRERELHQLRRPLDDAHPLPPTPGLADGIVVRTFRPGADDDAWLALNAASFASHPEQGSWGARDLHARMAESWFDPGGFLLAERAGTLVGFHWTKVHAATDDSTGPGEVYVLGVSPDAQRLGLGRALLLRGLHHLAGRGCPAVLLYVDGDNAAAMGLYERDGFVTFDLDVQWRRR